MNHTVINMVDLKNQYKKIDSEIEAALLEAARATKYIKGPQVAEFEHALATYLNAEEVVSCGNGTDALQIALMAAGLKPGDEVIVPAFTYVATAEVIALLGLNLVMVDVDRETFNIDPEGLDKIVSDKTKAIVPVHLFGQCANLEAVMQFAEKHHLFVIEDNAQSLGTEFTFSDSTTSKAGAIGHIGCHSFFPTKNLGCFGDGGAISTNDKELAKKCRMIASHGQNKKYHHEVVGVNSRLDTLQAAILNVKLKQLDGYIKSRSEAAQYYLDRLKGVDAIELPTLSPSSKHTFNQFTLKVKENRRDELKDYLQKKGIPSMIYYPIPLYKQNAFKEYAGENFRLKNTEELCNSVLSIPMHTELNKEIQDYIIDAIRGFE